MTELDELVLISAVAADIDGLTDDEMEHLWMHLQDADAETRRIFKRAAHAVRTKRLAMAAPMNRMAA